MPLLSEQSKPVTKQAVSSAEVGVALHRNIPSAVLASVTFRLAGMLCPDTQ